jgi:hypothetical protein
VGDPVALLLADPDLGRQRVAVRERAEHLVKQLSGVLNVLPGSREQLEQPLIFATQEGRESEHGLSGENGGGPGVITRAASEGRRSISPT